MKNLFKNGNNAIECHTVGEVITALQQLPSDLPVHQGFEESVDLVVFKDMQDDEHLSFKEGGDYSYKD